MVESNFPGPGKYTQTYTHTHSLTIDRNPLRAGRRQLVSDLASPHFCVTSFTQHPFGTATRNMEAENSNFIVRRKYEFMMKTGGKIRARRRPKKKKKINKVAKR